MAGPCAPVNQVQDDPVTTAFKAPACQRC